MSIPRITQILEKKDLQDVEFKQLVYAWAEDISDNLDSILVELKKLNLQNVSLGADEVDDRDVEE
jgi:hypothetical protein